jgi:DNA-directed RNA polymerase specialized sigma24 family protein
MADELKFAEFMSRIRAGDDDAARELVRQYEPLIRREVLLRIRDDRLNRAFDSMDVSQSALASFFTRAVSGNYQLNRPEQLAKLLITMARNKLVSCARSERRQRTSPAYAVFARSAAPGALTRRIQTLNAWEKRPLLCVIELVGDSSIRESSSANLIAMTPSRPPNLNTRAAREHTSDGATPGVEQGLEEFARIVAGRGELSQPALAALIRLHMKAQLRSGGQCLAENYLQRFPSVADDPELAVDVIYSEFLTREEAGQEPRLEDYRARFPKYAQVLTEQIGLHQALRETDG